MSLYAKPSAPIRLLLLSLGALSFAAGVLLRSSPAFATPSVADFWLSFAILGGAALFASTAVRPLQVAGLTVSALIVGSAALLAVMSFTRSSAASQLAIATSRFRSEEALLRLKLVDPTYLQGPRPRDSAAIHAELRALGAQQSATLTRLRHAVVAERQTAVVLRVLFLASLLAFAIQFHYRARHIGPSPPKDALPRTEATPPSGQARA